MPYFFFAKMLYASTIPNAINDLDRDQGQQFHSPVKTTCLDVTTIGPICQKQKQKKRHPNPCCYWTRKHQQNRKLQYTQSACKVYEPPNHLQQDRSLTQIIYPSLGYEVQ